MNKSPRRKVLIGAMFLIVGGALFGAFLAVSSWYDSNKIIPPYLQVNVESGWFRVEKRPLLTPIVQVTLEYPVTVDTPIKEYVCKKFEERCKEALAIVQCESGWKEDALGVNDPSVGWSARADAGLFQINSQHWPEVGGLTAMLDPYKNTDVAHQMFEASGKTWNAWFAHGTPCYEENLYK